MARQAREPGMMKVRAGGERERYFKGRHTKPLYWISGLWGSAEGLQQLLGGCHLTSDSFLYVCALPTETWGKNAMI